MANLVANINNHQNNGGSFISQILQKLPYVSANVLSSDVNNSRYELFNRLSKRNEMRMMKSSVIVGPALNNDQFTSGRFTSNKAYHDYIYANIDVDKIRRLSEYRRMGSFGEVSDCLDEICDEVIVKDENEKIISLNFASYASISDEAKSEIKKEFYKFISIYDLENKGWSYARRLLTEGELFFENIVHEDKKDLGIIGVLSIPGDLINPLYDNIQNNIIQNFIFQKPINLIEQQDQSGRTSNLQQPDVRNTLQQQLIALEGKQVTYIHSGMWNEDQSIRIPFIENCRKAYKQLSLLEDSIVIYRMVRAPERLKFKIDVGNMPPAKAESYLKQLMHSHWNKQTYNSNNEVQGAGNSYNPQSMLDSYWFSKRNGEVGSDVELMQGGANLGQLDDLMYFVNKLYRSLKVPLTRLNPNETFKDGAEILREELKFAKFIIRIQKQLAAGFKDAFITHLKLRNWWKEFKLHDSLFSLEFSPPSNFFAIRQQQLLELKFKNFSDMAQNDGISNTFAQRHYLDYSDNTIAENMEWKRKDASLRWELSQIETNGPNWREQLEAAESASQEASAMETTSGGGGGGGFSSSIPEFGGGGGGEGEEPAGGGEEEPTPAETPATEQPPE
jgi:hypothetical protein